jgi:outer membrane protein OmpA-like peptidoglycan-associated protein
MNYYNGEVTMFKNASRVCIVLGLAGLMTLMGCAASSTTKGGAIGAGAGGVIGGIIGKQTGNTAVGAIIGAAIGGSAGALIGHKMDKQAEEMKQKVDGANIERVGEGIKITFASGILFKTGSADLQPQAKQNVEKLAQILKEYPDTNILIEGHTDSDGTDALNQKLSERRAQAVATYAQSLGVSSARFQTIGYGESQPVASNDTAEGKQANRRVEIAVMANDKMKQAAQSGKL